jgi:hypothetical protein
MAIFEERAPQAQASRIQHELISLALPPFSWSHRKPHAFFESTYFLLETSRERSTRGVKLFLPTRGLLSWPAQHKACGVVSRVWNFVHGRSEKLPVRDIWTSSTPCGAAPDHTRGKAFRGKHYRKCGWFTMEWLRYKGVAMN